MAAALLVFVSLRPSGLAQSSGEGAPPREPPPPPALGPDRGDPPKFLEGLSEEARERFRAAREKALEDPKLQQLRKNAELARREFFRAMRDKMLEIDPGLADIVRRQVSQRKAWRLWGGVGLRGLTDEEREKLFRAMDKVDSDPAVEAAKKKHWEASSTGERKAAAENYRKMIRQAMARVDPSIVPILDKLASEKDATPDPFGSVLEK